MFCDKFCNEIALNDDVRMLKLWEIGKKKCKREETKLVLNFRNWVISEKNRLFNHQLLVKKKTRLNHSRQNC